MAEFPRSESDEPTTIQCAELKEANGCVVKSVIQEEEAISELKESIRELESRNLEISACRDQALVELQALNQTEATLRQKTEELARSNEALEQFASLAAHDLQEPLHSIQAFIDLLRVKQGATLNEQGHHYLNRVTLAASRMQQLIEGLLLYSRVNAPDSECVSLSLGKVVQDIQSDFESTVDEFQAEIQVGELPVIQSDAVLLRQLLQNLIGNALKFHKKGVVPVIRISGMIIQDRRQIGIKNSKKLCQISIEDRGIGIPSECLDKIFGMFKRLHRKDEYEGTGIGLAVCKRIADQLGGVISVQSVLGEGSIFTVTLPAVTPIMSLNICLWGWSRNGDS